jgi:hypothetical protein
MVRLSAILGGPEKACIVEESEFVTESGCPPDQMEAWLEDHWHAYDVGAVLAGEQAVGEQPMLLVRQFDGYFTTRLYSPTSKLVKDNAQIVELRRIFELSPPQDLGAKYPLYFPVNAGNPSPLRDIARAARHKSRKRRN